MQNNLKSMYFSEEKKKALYETLKKWALTPSKYLSKSKQTRKP